METKKTEENGTVGKTEEVIERITIKSPEELAAYMQQNFTEASVQGNGILQGLADGIIGDGKLTEQQQCFMDAALPMQVAGITVEEKELGKGECWDLIENYGESNLTLNVGTLTMDTGSHIECRGRALNLKIDKLVRKHSKYSSSVSYDIGLFGTDGQDGQDGVDGSNGQDGANGKDGKNWSSGIAGDDGGKGADGAPGGHGTDGAKGSDGQQVIDAEITIRQLEEPVTIAALPGKGGNGGNGGNGGKGGRGGKGGNGCDTGCEGSNGGDGGNGGNGGDGGNGGNGGNGGSGGIVRVFVPKGAKGLINTLCSVPKGGDGGSEGKGGAAGEGGDKGTGGKHHYDGNAGSNGTKTGEKGKSGSAGNAGIRATVNVSEKVM